MTTEKLSFQKLVATGNDFLFIDARERSPVPASERSAVARRLCDRHFGAGGDGLIFVENGQGDHLKWDFYNSDGSRAEMCGNASRCVGRWAQVNLQKPSVGLETVAGLVRVEAVGPEVVSNLDYVRVDFSALQAEVHGKKVAAMLVNTGVPHAVIEIDRLERAREAESVPLIQAFRWHPFAGQAGANVTFLQLLGDAKFATMTFERGVEGFTLSCGTGVLAAAAVGLKKAGRGPEGIRCEMETPGGCLNASFGPQWKGARLEGAAELIYEAEVADGFLAKER